MTSRSAFLTVVLAVVAVAVAGCREATTPQTLQPTPGALEPTPVPARLVLFFPGGDTLLHRELRDVPELPIATSSRVRLIVEELLAGSRQGFAAAFPWPASLNAVFLDRDGNAYLDFSQPPAGAVQGTAGEVALTYATVNSLVANCPGVERVQLLFGGNEVATLGHLDLSRPLAPLPALIAP